MAKRVILDWSDEQTKKFIKEHICKLIDKAKPEDIDYKGTVTIGSPNPSLEITLKIKTNNPL